MDKSFKKHEVLSFGIMVIRRGFFVFCVALGLLQWSGVLRLEMAYVVFLLANYLLGSLNNVCSLFCRGVDQVKVLTVSSFWNMFVIVGCNLLFLLGFQWGLYGYLLADSLGKLASTFYIILRAKLYRHIRWNVRNKELETEMLKFSAPLILSSLSWWINNASDKYILTFFCGVSAVGIYGVAYKIPTILKVFSDVIARAFSISAIKEFDYEDKDGFIGRSYSMFSFFMTLFCSVIMLVNVWLAKILFAGEFFEAWRFVPPLLISVLMNQLSLSCESIFVGAKRTKVISWTATMGALINTAANFILIPHFGAYGAAVATAIGFACFWGLRYYRLVQIVQLKNQFRRECTSYFLLVVQAVAAYYGNHFWYVQIMLLAGILALYRKELQEGIVNMKGKIRRQR